VTAKSKILALPGRPTPRSNRLLLRPEILIFDVDGVLVDVRETFWLSALQTVRHLTGKRATWADLYKWKRKSGNNDDWNMISNWVTALGRPVSYLEARAAFEKFYWDYEGRPGNVRKEKILVTPAQLQRWARR
jgi:phosphoglycolate phosphatase-like HAD superfamily hydrolase